MTNYSVLMPLSHQELPDILEQSLRSIAGQTVPPREILFACDHRTPDSLQSVVKKCITPASAAIEHRYIDCTDLHKNGGKLGAILARGVEQCHCEFVARMDSDDIATPQRCELQLRAFEKNPRLVLIGGISAEFSSTPSQIEAYRRPPTDWQAIVKFAQYRNPFNHPTVMFRRKDILEAGNYDPLLVGCEDYDLWYRIIASGKEVANLPDVLLLSRAGSEMIKRRRSPQNTKSYFELKLKMLQSGFISPIQYALSASAILFLRYAPQSLVERLYSRALRKAVHKIPAEASAKGSEPS